jgi:hypothetical protein
VYTPTVNPSTGVEEVSGTTPSTASVAVAPGSENPVPASWDSGPASGTVITAGVVSTTFTVTVTVPEAFPAPSV